MKKVIFILISIPIILLASCNLWIYKANKDRQYSEKYISTYLEKYHDVELVKLRDSNEEFPLCCPEFMATLKVGENEIEFYDLKVSSLDESGGFLIWSFNGNRIFCKSDHGYYQLGINAINFPDAGYQKLKIKNLDDLMTSKEKLFDYLDSWPCNPESGIKIESNFDSGNLSCYIQKN